MAKGKGKKGKRGKKQFSLVKDGGKLFGLGYGALEAGQQTEWKPSMTQIGRQSLYRFTGYSTLTKDWKPAEAKGTMIVIASPIVAKVGRKLFGSIPLFKGFKVF